MSVEALWYLARGSGAVALMMLTVVVALGIGTRSLMFDPYAQLNLVDLIVPFGSQYRPLWVGLGALALDLVIAIVVTSLLRERIGQRVWRAVHWFAYAMWPIALLHGIGSGTDRSTTWMLGIDVVCTLSVLAVLVAVHPVLRQEPPRTAPAAPVLSPASRGAR
jgi:sulfoxide reductase heme-binding subunit YedZ